MNSPISIRPYLPGDKNFILSTWLRGLYFGNEMFGLMDQDTYYHHYHDIVERYLASPSVVINIACLPDEPDVILGYSVTSTDRKALHWVFVKSAFRRMGIAKSLVPTTVVTATHITKVGASVLKKKHLSFNPFHL